MIAKLRALLIAVILITMTLGVASYAATTDEAIADKMSAMFDLDPDHYRIELLSNPLKTADVSVDQIALRPLSQKDPLGLYSAMASVTVDGKVLESGQVRMRIRKYESVLVLTDRIVRHEALGPDKLTLKEMDVTTLREKPMTSATSLSDMRARRNLRRGDILTSGDIEPIPDLESGRDVTIVYSSGMCRITAEGRTLQSGAAGEYVKVKNKTSGKIIIARVVDGTAVAVDP
ncbi:MAG: flagellar basal body P-ring formation protein FlgA [candidate division Zixibacteria bacterium]|nr:flagellar basal body P-ring formation protein FlgA [candidate division Zixibacteria bacterium]